MSRIDDLKKENELLREQAEIKKNLLEQDRRYGKPTMKAMQEMSDKILDNEEDIAKIRKADNTAKRLSLAKQIEKLNKSAFKQIQKKIGAESLSADLTETMKNGTKEQVKQSTNLTKLLNDVSSGLADAEEVARRMKTEDFGKMLPIVEKIFETLENSPDLSKKFGIEDKAQQRINDFRDKITDIADLLSSPKAMGVAVLGLAAKIATDFATQALEVRKELGTSAIDSARLAGNMSVASFQARLLGGDTQAAASAVTSLTREFGSLDVVSASVARQAGSITAQFGIGGENLGKLTKQMSVLNGGSLETNLNTLETVGNLARAERVAPADVLNDMAENTETFAKFSMQGGKNLAKAAIEARKLGLNLSAVDKISESILDIESSIEKQMEASVLLGRQLNLDKARELALSGDLEGVLAEVKNQVGGAEALSRMNVVQRKALADAVGLEVSELSKLASGQDNVNKLANEQFASQIKTFTTIAGIATILGGIIGMITGGTALGAMARGAGKGALIGGGIGIAGGAAAATAQGLLPKMQTGGTVRETGMAVVHRGETISGTAGQFGRESNKLLKELISQNASLMGKLTNKVGDLALSS